MPPAAGQGDAGCGGRPDEAVKREGTEAPKMTTGAETLVALLGSHTDISSVEFIFLTG